MTRESPTAKFFISYSRAISSSSSNSDEGDVIVLDSSEEGSVASSHKGETVSNFSNSKLLPISRSWMLILIVAVFRFPVECSIGKLNSSVLLQLVPDAEPRLLTAGKM